MSMIHDKIKQMWREAIAEGKNPPPLNEVLSSFPKGAMYPSEEYFVRKVAERLQNKVQ